MRSIRFFFMLFLFTAISAYAQVAVSIRTSHPSFLLYDNIFIKMSMRNYSGHPIAFGSAKGLRGTVEFLIFDRFYKKVPPRNPDSLSVLSNVILAPGQTRTFTFNLNMTHQFTSTGIYQVRAVIRHPLLDKPYQSNETNVLIRPGEIVWTRTFGIPDYTGRQKKIQTRTANLLKFFDGRNTYFILRLEDEKKVYAVKHIGFEMGPNLRPQIEIDSVGSIHIMVAASPKVFAYYIYNYDGILKEREIYIRTSTKPFLVREPATAKMYVDGGRKARKDVDYEDLKDVPFLDEVIEEKQNFGKKAESGSK